MMQRWRRYGLYAAAVGVGLLTIASLAPHRRPAPMPAPTIGAPTVEASLSPVSFAAFDDRGPTGGGARRALALARTAMASPEGPSDDAGSPSLPAETVRSEPERKLSRAAVTALADRCAPTAPAAVLASIVHVESGGSPLRIGVNGPRHRTYTPPSTGEAVALARSLIHRGASIDLGLAQINSANLTALGLSVEDAFDPCRNLAAAAVMINRGYAQALHAGEPDRPILETAYSIYNSGDGVRGIVNGYAAKVEAAGSVRR